MNRTIFARLRVVLVALFALGAAALPRAARAEARTICVYDPAGRSGDYYALMSDFARRASAWGADVTIQPYTDEETAAKDYEARKCDGVSATGVRLQRFNRFSATIEAIGALTSYDQLEAMVRTLATSAGAAKSLSRQGNTTIGFMPVGAVYLFVRDRSVDTVSELAGKRIATMDYDPASKFMVNRVGAVMVPADLGSIGPKFNNGDVDACYVSAPAYRPFELHRGLGTGGGVLKAPLAQATLQVMIREDRFPEGFVDKAREALLERFDEALAFVKQAEAEIPDRYWVDVPPETYASWSNLFQGVRVDLRDKGAYDGSMLRVMRQLRCSKDPSRAECVEKKE